MAGNQLKIVISILKEISEDNIPTHDNYDISLEKFNDILDAMQNDNLITGLSCKRGDKGKILMAFHENIKITIKGMQYLNENSALVKTYKGLKEIREWLPF